MFDKRKYSIEKKSKNIIGIYQSKCYNRKDIYHHLSHVHQSMTDYHLKLPDLGNKRITSESDG
jgi:hypothetical protein